MSDGAVDLEKMRLAAYVAGIRQIVELAMQIDYREVELALRMAWSDPTTTESDRDIMSAFHRFRYELERLRLDGKPDPTVEPAAPSREDIVLYQYLAQRDWPLLEYTRRAAESEEE